MNRIRRVLIKESDRVTHTAALFGFHFPLYLEPLAYAVANSLSPDYKGGYWDFYSLSNNSFYMVPAGNTVFRVICENGFEGKLSSDAFGVTTCMYAYSRLSFSGMLIADVCAQQYHLLRDYALEHGEAAGIMAAVD